MLKTHPIVEITLIGEYYLFKNLLIIKIKIRRRKLIIIIIIIRIIRIIINIIGCWGNESWE